MKGLNSDCFVYVEDDHSSQILKVATISRVKFKKFTGNAVIYIHCGSLTLEFSYLRHEQAVKQFEKLNAELTTLFI